MTKNQTHILPDWRQLCQAALLETNPVKLLERIAHARNAVLDRIEDGYTKPLNGEQHDLRDALTTLDSLQRITERQNGYQSKTSSLPRDQSADQL
jgi:dsDNA-specific endonuclease/ATPase MutS2